MQHGLLLARPPPSLASQQATFVLLLQRTACTACQARHATATTCEAAAWQEQGRAAGRRRPQAPRYRKHYTTLRTGQPEQHTTPGSAFQAAATAAKKGGIMLRPDPWAARPGRTAPLPPFPQRDDIHPLPPRPPATPSPLPHPACPAPSASYKVPSDHSQVVLLHGGDAELQEEEEAQARGGRRGGGVSV